MSFQLPSFLEDSFLNALRAEMKAPLSESFRVVSPVRLIELPEIERKLLGEGVDVGFDEVQVLEDDTLAYKGYRVLVYIRDVASHSNRQSLPRFHFAHCNTLAEMREKNRWGRYVVANREDGRFLVNLIDRGELGQLLELNVCQNCLAKISWRGFTYKLAESARVATVKQFRLTDFFEQYPRDLLLDRPEHTSDSAPLNDYPENWGDISEEKKRRAAYRCAKCGLTLSLRESRYLHVHHRNGLKHDCSDSNLAVLCVRCHADEPLHGHMKTLPDYEEFVRRFGA